MVFLNLDRCESCMSLPSLGQLPYLRELHITKITRLQKVGLEFYGNGNKAFNSLRIIKFKDMPNWEEWSTGNQSGSEGFTLLQELYIEGCPKLTGKLPEILPSLAKLVIISCPILSDSMPKVPRLRELEMTGCKTFVSLSEEMMKENKQLQTMSISNCSSLVSIHMDGLSTTLKSLEISECRKLQLFHPEMLIEESQCYSVLKRLCLKSCCDSLTHFQLALFQSLKIFA